MSKEDQGLVSGGPKSTFRNSSTNTVPARIREQRDDVSKDDASVGKRIRSRSASPHRAKKFGIAISYGPTLDGKFYHWKSWYSSAKARDQGLANWNKKSCTTMGKGYSAKSL